MLYADRPLFCNPTGWREGTVTAVDDAGHVVVTLPSGEILSVQPDGTYQTRTADTRGPYEVATQSYDKLVYRPIDPATNKTYFYVIPMVES